MQLVTLSLLFFLVVLGLFVYLKASLRFHWFDIPNEERKIHSSSKPTSAGLVFVLPVLLSPFFIESSSSVNSVLFLTCIMLILGGVDDFYNLSSRIRLVVQLLVSFALLYIIYKSSAIPFYLLIIYYIGIIWWLNLYNFMDGADGMAALHAILPCCAYIYLLQYDSIIFLISILFVALSAFLLFNFPKSKMFMGDSGSLSIAFLLAFIALYGISKQIFDPDLVVSFHLLFILDATLTLLYRLIKGHSVTQAHHLHLFQSLIFHGRSHWVVTTIYALVSTLIILLTLYLHLFGYDLLTRSVVLTVEIVILTILWFKFIDRDRFDLK